MKIAFIGGRGHHYLRDALADTSVCVERPVAVACDGYDVEASRALAVSLGEARWFEEPARMLEEFRPDAVSVGAVFGHTGELASMCLEQGIPTVCDKPVAATWEQLRRLRAAAEATRAPLATEFSFRCQKAFRAARAAVAGGRIGPVALATAQKSYQFGVRPSWYGERVHYGGTMLWVAVHGIDAIRFVTGRRFLRVLGRQGNVSKPAYRELEDYCVALFDLEGGGVGMVHADYLRPAKAATHGDDRLRVIGGNGVIEIRDERCRLTTRNETECDITDSVAVEPMHRELLRALRGEATEYFGTTASLELAEIGLLARDAADSGRELEIPRGLQA